MFLLSKSRKPIKRIEPEPGFFEAVAFLQDNFCSILDLLLVFSFLLFQTSGNKETFQSCFKGIKRKDRFQGYFNQTTYNHLAAHNSQQLFYNSQVNQTDPNSSCTNVSYFLSILMYHSGFILLWLSYHSSFSFAIMHAGIVLKLSH